MQKKTLTRQLMIQFMIISYLRENRFFLAARDYQELDHELWV